MSPFRALPIAVLAVSFTASTSLSQEYCLRPAEPTIFSIDKDADPELYAFVNEEHQRYFIDMESYIDCLRREHADAIAAVKEMLAIWTTEFREDAAISLDQ